MSTELHAQLGIEDLDLILKERRLRWYGHMEHSNGAVKTTFAIQVDGKCGPGRPKMTWKQLTERDCRELKLSAIDPHSDNWRSGPSCSKLTTSLVNDSLKFQTLISQICQYFLLKKCEELLQCKSFSHFVNKIYQCIWL